MPISCILFLCFRYTLNDWWIENKLTGVPRLLVGQRTPEGVVHTLQMINTDDMPARAEVRLQNLFINLRKLGQDQNREPDRGYQLVIKCLPDPRQVFGIMSLKLSYVKTAAKNLDNCMNRNIQ